ncbi:MAG: hypothetical protein JWR69_4184, partial [Pedosphaera sp.]|nr:hypothetical protein [Pedosphaera sp.]
MIVLNAGSMTARAAVVRHRAVMAAGRAPVMAVHPVVTSPVGRAPVGRAPVGREDLADRVARGEISAAMTVVVTVATVRNAARLRSRCQRWW